MRSIFVALTALGLTCVVPAWTSAGSAAAQADKNDLRLFRTIQSAVLNYPHYTVFDSISASIDDGGIVTLSGKVTMPFKREEIERRVREIDGVRQVRNQIEVLPASKGDDELRLGIARAIYNNPTFQPYANRANPPIHVIVERGRVTLEGTINDQSERLLALSIARSFGAFEVTDQLKTEAEARQELEKL